MLLFWEVFVHNLHIQSFLLILFLKKEKQKIFQSIFQKRFSSNGQTIHNIYSQMKISENKNKVGNRINVKHSRPFCQMFGDMETIYNS